MNAFVLNATMLFLLTTLLTLATMFDPHKDTFKSPFAWSVVAVCAVFTLWGVSVL